MASDTPEIDNPEALAEVTEAFARYEAALMANDVAALTALFHDDPRTLRYASPRTCTAAPRSPASARRAARQAWRGPSRAP